MTHGQVSRALVESNRGVLATTRRRIAASRRQLNGAFALTGGSAPELRDTIRTLLAQGLLAPVQDTVLAGRGSGKICAVCGAPITTNDVEYEVEGLPRSVRCHVPCFVTWREESRRATSRGQ